MIKIFLIIILFIKISVLGFSQGSYRIDSLKQELAVVKEDTGRVQLMASLCYEYTNSNPDSAARYGEQALALAKRIRYSKGEVRSLIVLCRLIRIRGDIPMALNMSFKALQIAEDNNYKDDIIYCLNSIASTYAELKDYQKAKATFLKAIKMYDDLSEGKLKVLPFNVYLNLSRVFQENNQLDSALLYLQKAAELNINKSSDDQAIFLKEEASLQFKLGNHQAALDNLHNSISMTMPNFNHRRTSIACFTLASFLKKLNQPDSAIYYAKMALDEARASDYKQGILEPAKLLAELYESGNLKEAHHYLKITYQLSDELFGENKIRNLQKTISDEQERQREIEAGKIARQNQLKQYYFLTGFGLLLVIAFILYRNNLQKQKVNAVLEKTLTNLKSTQAQLIQSEKMASLGELTAGIAHEIQNPLNFVNNFSEVSNELIDEMKTEFKKGDTEEGFAIADGIKQNLEKILHHGKRADAIVKGMLQHSSSGSGKKESTDINKLADEYLRLAYHGLRAKDKSFNAAMKTDFDENIGNINIIPQDIGRVILNLITNAFYVVHEKSKQNIAGYEPTVEVSTKKDGNKVLISVKDNGPGIPQKVLDKIFQPFFTTKPTGLGTGLGLSLSYEIVKANGGEIKVETKVDEENSVHFGKNEGATFIIQLPIKTGI